MKLSTRLYKDLKDYERWIIDNPKTPSEKLHNRECRRTIQKLRKRLQKAYDQER